MKNFTFNFVVFQNRVPGLLKIFSTHNCCVLGTQINYWGMSTEEALAAARGRVYNTPPSGGYTYHPQQHQGAALYTQQQPPPPVPKYNEITQHSAPPGGSQMFRKVKRINFIGQSSVVFLRKMCRGLLTSSTNVWWCLNLTHTKFRSYPQYLLNALISLYKVCKSALLVWVVNYVDIYARRRSLERLTMTTSRPSSLAVSTRSSLQLEEAEYTALPLVVVAVVEV